MGGRPDGYSHNKLVINMENRYKIAFVVWIILLSVSCMKQEKNLSNNGEARVNINLLGVESESLDNNDFLEPSQRLAPVTSKFSEDPDRQIIPFGDKMAIVATLSRANTVSSLDSKASISNANRANIVRNPMTENVRYRVMVYDDSGIFVIERDYEVGQESTAGGFALNAGFLYTFVAYSLNTVAALPEAVDKENLNTVSLNNIGEQLLYFRKDLTLTFGNNSLDVILKHQFSEITTTIELDETTAGNITGIEAPFIRPVRQNASIRLSDGAITYGTVSENGVSVNFPDLGSGVRSVTSDPTLLISPTTTSAELTIGNLTANGMSRSNVILRNLNISPGVRYNLVMRLQSPCTEEVSGGTSFSISDGQSQTFTAPAADFGFTFDIYRLDNSFNLEINGSLLAVQELQFQAGVVNLARNIEFADGTIWGVGGIPQIYNMNGNAASPIIRVIIGATGDISLLGSKNANGGNLQPLRLTNGNTLNRIQWNANTNNTVIATQSVVGQTHMSGAGYGLRIIPCD